MKKLVFVVICLVLTACDFTVPLSISPQKPIDDRAIGLWERTKENGGTERMLVLPFNEREYFLSWPEGANTELYAKAHLFEFSDDTLVQLEWFGNSDGGVPDDNVIFQVARYSIKDGVLEIEMLNPDVVGKEHKSSAELAESIEANIDNPELFDRKMIFRKISSG